MRKYIIFIYITLTLIFTTLAFTAPSDDPLSEAIALMDENMFRQASVILDEYIADNPNNPDAYYRRGNCRFYLEDYEGAAEDYTKAFELDDTFYKVLSNRALVYAELEQYELAIEDFNLAIEINPDEEQLYINRGMVYKEMGLNDEAMADLGDLVVLVTNAVIYLDEETEEDVEGMLRELGELAIPEIDERIGDETLSEDSLYRLYNVRGMIYYDIGEYETAIVDFNTAIELNPEEEQTYINRGFVYKALGDDKNALNDLGDYIDELVADMQNEDKEVSSIARTKLVKVGKYAVIPIINSPETDITDVETGKIKVLKEIGDERAISYLVERLESEDSFVISRAIETLIAFGELVISPLFDVVESDADVNVKGKATYILGTIGGDEVAERLIELFDYDEELHGDMVFALALTGDKRGVDVILPLLENPDPGFRAYVISNLAKFHEPRIIPVVLEDFKDEDVEVRGAIVEFLYHLYQTGDERVVPELLKIVKEDEVVDVKGRAIYRLGSIGDPVVIPYLIEELTSEDVMIIDVASKALLMIDMENTLSDVIALLESEDPDIRSHTVATLATIAGTPEVLEELKGMLDDPDPNVVYITASQFQMMGDETIIPKLLDLLQNAEDNEIRASIIYPLTNYGTPSIVDALIGVLDDENPVVVFNAIKAMTALENTSVMEKVLELLKREHPKVVSAVSEYIITFQTDETVDVLLEKLGDDDENVVVNSAKILNEMEGETHLSKFIELVDDERLDVRAIGVQIISNYLTPEVIEVLKGNLDEENDEVLMLSMQALQKTDDPSLIPEFLKLLNNEHPKVRAYAGKYLFESGDPEIIEEVERVYEAETDEKTKEFMKAFLYGDEDGVEGESDEEITVEIEEESEMN